MLAGRVNLSFEVSERPCFFYKLLIKYSAFKHSFMWFFFSSLSEGIFIMFLLFTK